MISVSASEHVYIIAEAGVNHNGQLTLAKRLVDAAADAQADAVKFQTFRAEQLVSPQAPKAQYQLATTGQEESQLEMLRRFELPPEAYAELFQYCKTKNILFLSTPFDTDSADLLDELPVSHFKIASGDVTNIQLLRYVAGKHKPVILSTGMSTLEEVKEALRVMAAANNTFVTLLHCVSEYPAPPEQVNLQAMVTMRDTFRVPVGYSDHTQGVEVALAAVALGASVIEKHLTLGRNMLGPDHRASLEPAEFKQMVRQIRIIESALGDGIKRPAPCEASNRLLARRSLFATVPIPKGTVIHEEMVECKRPGEGISPLYYDRVIGRRVTRSFKAGEALDWDGLQDG